MNFTLPTYHRTFYHNIAYKLVSSFVSVRCLSSHLYLSVLCKLLYNGTNRCTYFPNLFWLKNEPLHVSGSSSAHHQEFNHCTLGTGICHTGLKTTSEKSRNGPARKLSSNMYGIYQCQMYSDWTPDDGQRNCPKHVEVHFLAKTNLENKCI